jgi:hypothetical protein
MANSKFVVDTGLVVGPLTIFASNGDIRTSGNIVYTNSGPDNTITAPGPSQGFINSTTLYFPTADYAVTQITVDGVVNTYTESSGPINIVPTTDAFGAVTAESSSTATDIYDCMEPSGAIETTDLGELT